MLNNNEVVKLMKDAISLYRGYRWYIVSVGLLTLIVGVIMIVFLCMATLSRLWR